MRRFLVLGVVGALLLGGCGGSGGEETSGQAAAAQTRLEAKRQAAQHRAAARDRAKARARREAVRRARVKAQRERRAEARQVRAEEAEAAEAEEAVAAEAAVSEEEASECDPNYSGACLDPYASDYDCSDGEGDGPEYTGTVIVVGEDHYGLDSDSDGTGCEID